MLQGEVGAASEGGAEGAEEEPDEAEYGRISVGGDAHEVGGALLQRRHRSPAVEFAAERYSLPACERGVKLGDRAGGGQRVLVEGEQRSSEREQIAAL